MPEITVAATSVETLPLRQLRRRRFAVAFNFALLGLVVGGWVSRIPDIKEQVGLDSAGWGTVTVSSSLGSLAAVLTGMGLAAHVSPRRLTVLAAPLALLATIVLGLAHSTVMLVPALLFYGFCTGSLSGPVNALAAATERAYGRPIMATFHACFSVGTLAGGLLGAGAARAQLSPEQQFSLTAGFLLVGFLVCRSMLPRVAAVAPGEQSLPVHKRWTRQLVLLSGIAACSSIGEGAASQWSALYSHDYLKASSGLAAVTYAAFALTMTIGRSTGDRFVQRLGRARFLRYSGVLAATGLGFGLAAGTTVGAIIGFAVMGAGMACLIPTAYAAAGSQPSLPPAQGVSTVVTTAWPAFLIGPPVIGWIAQASNLRVALAFVLLAPLTVAALAGGVRETSTIRG